MFHLLIACGPGAVVLEDEPKGGDDPETDTATTPTDSGPDDTGEPTVPTEPDEALCGELAGVVGVGTTWEYQLLAQSSYEVSRVATVDSVEDDVVRVEDLVDYDYGAYVYHYVYEYLYQCNGAGLQLMASSTRYEYSYNGNDYSNETQTIYDEPVQLLPVDAALGDSWDASYVGTTVNNGFESPYRMELSYSVIGEESIEVGYGEVDALRIMSEYNGQPYQTFYVGRGLGTVQDWQWELIDYAP